MARRLRKPISIDELMKQRKVVLDPIEPSSEYEDDDDDDYSLDGVRLLVDQGLIARKQPYRFDLDYPDVSSLEVKMVAVNLSAPGQIKKLVVRHGNGPVAPSEGLVYYNYLAFVVGQDDPFDTSHISNLICSNIGEVSECLFGLKLGLRTMKKGEVAHFLISPNLAFGEHGCPHNSSERCVPPDSTMFYTVHLVDHVDAKTAMSPLYVRTEEMSKMPFEKILSTVKEMKEDGNSFFSARNFRMAIRRYKAGIHLLQEHASATEEEHEERLRAISVLRMNISVGHIQLQDPMSAKKELTKALADGFCPLAIKAYLRLAEVNLLLHEYKAATAAAREGQKSLHLMDNYMDRQKLEQSLSGVLNKIESTKQTEKQRSKFMCKRMFQRHHKKG